MTRLMCSKDRNEVEFVKKELFRAGIRAEIRSNPVAAALRVNRLELWVQDERDYLIATKLFDALQARDGNCSQVAEASVAVALSAGELPAKVEVEDHEPEVTARRDREKDIEPEVQAAPQGDSSTTPNQELEQAEVWLEKEIQELLDRETKLTEDCATLQQEVLNLKDLVAQSQAQLNREVESRKAAEKAAADFSSVRAALESQIAQHAQSEDQLQKDMKELKAQIRPREEALAAAQAKLDAKNREVQSQQAAVAKLHTEMASREAQSEKLRDNLTQLRTEVAQERERRIAAEEKADKLASRQTALEEQLVHHTRLHQELQRELQDEQKQLRGYAGTLNNLRQKLQSNRSMRPGVDGAKPR